MIFASVYFIPVKRNEAIILKRWIGDTNEAKDSDNDNASREEWQGQE